MLYYHSFHLTLVSIRPYSCAHPSSQEGLSARCGVALGGASGCKADTVPFLPCYRGGNALRDSWSRVCGHKAPEDKTASKPPFFSSLHQGNWCPFCQLTLVAGLQDGGCCWVPVDTECLVQRDAWQGNILARALGVLSLQGG